jgi:hypothetical protein
MTDEQAQHEARRRWGVHGYAETKQVRGMTVFIVGDIRGGLYSSAGSSLSWEVAFDTADKLPVQVSQTTKGESMNPPDEGELRRMIGGANDEGNEDMKARLRDVKDPIRVSSPPEKTEHQAPPPRDAFLHLLVGPGAATLAFRRDPLRSGRIYVGVALCSPRDAYDKHRGRLISAGRSRRVEALAADRKRYNGLGFVFAAGGDATLDKEAFEAFEAWIGGAKSVWPLWLQAWADEWPGKPIPVALRSSLIGGAR